MKKFVFFFSAVALHFLGAFTPFSTAALGQSESAVVVPDTMAPVVFVPLAPAAVLAVRASDRSPFVHVDITAEDIQDRNSGQDLPYVLRATPSAVVTSDAGAGVGYTGMRLRGTDATRINVTINGIPLNDAESQGVYWVDLPDLASGVDDVQVVRGTGGSTCGAGAFGGAISVNTLDFSQESGGRLSVGGGSFGTRRSTVMFRTGRLASGWALKGRLSRTLSEGYIDRASSDLRSLQLSLERSWAGGRAVYTLLDGHERTYQAWWGVPEVALSDDAAAISTWATGQGYSERQTYDLLTLGRRANYYTYDDEVDDYGQKHHQFHVEQRLSGWNFSTALHWTAGAGYYEQFKPGHALSNYGLQPVISSTGDTTDAADVVRRRHLDNDFYGLVAGASRNWARAALTSGVAYHVYDGDHFGSLVWLDAPASAATGMPPVATGYRYYQSNGLKLDGSAFVRLAQRSNDGRLQLTVDVQARYVDYSAKGIDSDLRLIEIDGDSATFLFFNPKLGLDYRLSDEELVFASWAVANKEPSRADWIDAPGSTPRPERLSDLELGYKARFSKAAVALTAFHMAYKDQLVLTGALNDVGTPIRANVDASVRTGLELEAGWQAWDALEFSAQLTLMRSSIARYDEVLYDYTDGFDILTMAHEDADIAFSPRSIAGAQLLWHALNSSRQSLDLEVLFKHVGRQFLDNTSNENRSIEAYNVAELRATWSRQLNEESALRIDLWVHNALDASYSSNGYTYSYIWGDTVTENFYYPQAGRHFSVGLSYDF
ncbi:MAG: TonB-dependent receptor [Flavobacteriales bacterium]|nr:TonB-dependent receptor [Flavobacteriales bacterium]